mmetsp:Transcript_12312/g.12353  ORF Transcript_12312/g.12353 Transcript_12312/m.12353 type:complete len:149 (-) Transcript_12312:73-519(-)
MDEMPDVIKGSIQKIIESLIDLMRKYTRERILELRSKFEDKRNRWDEGTDEYNNLDAPFQKLSEWMEEYKDDAYSEDDDDDDNFEEDDYLWSRSDSCYYKSCLEDKEAPLFFKETLEDFRENKEEVYRGIIELIPEDSQKLLEVIMER